MRIKGFRYFLVGINSTRTRTGENKKKKKENNLIASTWRDFRANKQKANVIGW